MTTTHKCVSKGDWEPQKKLSKQSEKKMTEHSNAGPQTHFEISASVNTCDVAFTLGDKLTEGKTKIVYDVNSAVDGQCLIVSKDIITAGDFAKRNVMEGKAEMSTKTSTDIMKLLNHFGIKTSLIKWVNRTSFLAWTCDMIPIEWVVRRIATGSFLRHNKGVNEGYRFSPPKLETFYKDDENHDTQWSREVLEEAKLVCGGVTITNDLIDKIEKMSNAIFEILEQMWRAEDITLIDMKIEFGIRSDTKEIILADVIDNDSWSIWPSGDKRLMKDTQVYQNLTEVTWSDMKNLKENFRWVSEKVNKAVEFATTKSGQGKVAIVMESASDMTHCNKIKTKCADLGIFCQLYVSSAHKFTDGTLKLLAKVEADAVYNPIVIVAVAGRSNSLGPLLSGNTVLPVINCPPVSEKWENADIWSSLRLPSGLGCVTSMSPDTAATAAAQILAQRNFSVWAKLRVQLLQNWLNVKDANLNINE
ncbi:multifunctional protein ADE2-like [Clavelina lepadiformis]|uniref:PurE domain-containing protein n=1 Tax=Clavelina lepadiformis TaxID=159417 RepID=A0ABP0H0Z9_CLALP